MSATNHATTSARVWAISDCNVQKVEYCRDYEESKRVAAYASLDKLPKPKRILRKLTKLLKSPGQTITSCKPVIRAVQLVTLEILAFTRVAHCCSGDGDTIEIGHVPWGELKKAPLVGLYINISAALDARSSGNDGAATSARVRSQDQLKGFVAKYAKIVCDNKIWSDEVTSRASDIVYAVLSRYASMMTLLRSLQSASGSCVDEHILTVATRIMLEDHTHAGQSNVEAMLDKIIPRRGRFREAVGEEDGVEFNQLIEDGQHMLAVMSKSLVDISCVYLTETRTNDKNMDAAGEIVYRLGCINDSTSAFGVGMFDRKIVRFAFIPRFDLARVDMELLSMLPRPLSSCKLCTLNDAETARLLICQKCCQLSAGESAAVLRHFEVVANRYYGDAELVLEIMKAELALNKYKHYREHQESLDSFRKQVVENVVASIEELSTDMGTKRED